MGHLRASTLEALERFAAGGGKVLGVLLAPSKAFGPDGTQEVEARVAALLGLPATAEVGGGFALARREHPGGGLGAFLGGDLSVLGEGPGAARDAFAAAVRAGIGALITPDLEISNQEVFCLHRRRDGRDLYFLVNPTFQEQAMEVRLPGELAPALWDPSSGEERPAAARRQDGWTAFDLVLPPVGSVFVVTGGDPPPPAPPGGDPAAAVTLELDGPWWFTAEDDNALVATGWLAAPERRGDDPAAYAGPEVEERDWLPVVAGAWAYQLPVEPTDPWPIPVWYRVGFDVQDPPDRLALLVDGFDGDDPRVWLNGVQVPWTPARSQIDAQMGELDLSGRARQGRNVLAVRLLLREPTGGLVDHVKLLGSFALAGDAERGYRIAARPGGPARPASWTDQGYPFYP